MAPSSHDRAPVTGPGSSSGSGSGPGSGSVSGGTFLRAYAAALLVFLVVDGLWIVLVATRVYDAQMPDLVREDPRLVPAALFYLGFVAVLVHLAVAPALASTSSPGRAVARSAVTGAMVGATAYGTYALTALAVIEGFSTVVAVLDLVWGGVLGAAVAAGATAVLRRRAGTRARAGS